MKKFFHMFRLLAAMTACCLFLSGCTFGTSYAYTEPIGTEGLVLFKTTDGSFGLQKDGTTLLEDAACKAITYLAHPNRDTKIYAATFVDAGGVSTVRLYDYYPVDNRLKLRHTFSGTGVIPYTPSDKGLKPGEVFFKILQPDGKTFGLYDCREDQYTEESFVDYTFFNHDGLLACIAGKTPDGLYKVMDIFLKPVGDTLFKKVRCETTDDDAYLIMTNSYGLTGVWNLDFKPMLLDVYKDVECVHWQGTDDGPYWLVTTDSGYRGLYNSRFRPIVREEYLYSDIRLHYDYGNSLPWLELVMGSGLNATYTAATQYGTQLTIPYKYGLFYKDRVFYHLTGPDADEGYPCRRMQWEGRFYSAVVGAWVDIYMYDGYITVQSPDGAKLKYSGSEGGYELYDGGTTSYSTSSWASTTWYINQRQVVKRVSHYFNPGVGYLPPPPRNDDTYFSNTSLTVHGNQNFSVYEGTSYVQNTLAKIEERKARQRETVSTGTPSYNSGVPTAPAALVPAVPPVTAPSAVTGTSLGSDGSTSYKAKMYNIRYSGAEKRAQQWFDTYTRDRQYINNNGQLRGVGDNTYGQSATAINANSTVKMKVEQAQRELRNIRMEAMRDGITIPQSAMETAVVY